ncbi:MAG: hypothetical protein GX787_07430 [Tissierellia bacterium]|nr:hypothetical protein [Tissierellia bacterium]
MKKWISLILIGVLLMSTLAFGTIDEKLSNHWSKNEVDKVFVAYYFPYLAKNNFERFQPSASISEQDFNLSLNSLFKDFQYDVTGIGGTANMSRGDMVNILGGKLLKVGLKDDMATSLPFIDINTMNSDRVVLLRLLYNHGIIKGDSVSSFGPLRSLSQVEAIIILQRVKLVLEEMNNVPFKTLGIVQTFNNQEEIIITNQGDNVLVTITKQFPTPGYTMSVQKVMKADNDYRIYFNITPPDPDSVQLQVITYKTLTMEIEKSKLGDPPYKFTFDGYNKVTIKESM